MKNNRGVVLAATLIILLVLAVLIAGVLALSVSSTDMQSTRNESEQALYLAEAGVNRMIQQWRINTNSTPPPDSSGVIQNYGNFSVDGDPDGIFVYPGNLDYEYPVKATGTANPGTSREVSRTIRIVLQHRSSNIWDHPLASPDNGNPYQHGTFTYPKGYNSINNPPKVFKESLIPEPDWAAYHNLVSSDHHLYGKGSDGKDTDPQDPADSSTGYDGNTFKVKFKDGEIEYLVPVFDAKGKKTDTETITIPIQNGYYYIHGDVEIEGKVDFRGTLIATGDIRGLANPEITITPEKETGYCEPAIIAGGTINIQSGQTVINGIIWAEGQISLKADVNGAVYSKTGISIDSSSIIHYGYDILAYTPDEFPPRFFKAPNGTYIIKPGSRSWREVTK